MKPDPRISDILIGGGPLFHLRDRGRMAQCGQLVARAPRLVPSGAYLICQACFERYVEKSVVAERSE